MISDHCANLAVGRTWAHLGIGPGGLKDLSQPYLPIKFGAHLIILSLSCGARQVSKAYNKTKQKKCAVTLWAQSIWMGANPMQCNSGPLPCKKKVPSIQMDPQWGPSAGVYPVCTRSPQKNNICKE